MSEFHFIRPWLLLGFIPLILLVLKFYKVGAKKNVWQQVCDPHLLKSLLTHVGKSSHYLMLSTVFVIGSLMVIALAGPTWQKLPQPSFAKKQATVILLDMSKEMDGQDIKPSRLQRAKFKIEELLKLLPEGQVGFVVFTNEAFLVSPLTKDTHTLKLMLNELSTQIMPVDGSNISSGLKMAKNLIQQAGYANGNIILLTANQANFADIKTAKLLTSLGLHTSVIGVATELGAPIFGDYGIKHISKLDKDSLADIAQAGKGKYFPFQSNDHDIKKLVHFIKKEKSEYKKNKDTVATWKDEGRYLIILMLPLVLLGFRRGAIEGEVA